MRRNENSGDKHFKRGPRIRRTARLAIGEGLQDRFPCAQERAFAIKARQAAIQELAHRLRSLGIRNHADLDTYRQINLEIARQMVA